MAVNWAGGSNRSRPWPGMNDHKVLSAKRWPIRSVVTPSRPAASATRQGAADQVLHADVTVRPHRRSGGGIGDEPELVEQRGVVPGEGGFRHLSSAIAFKLLLTS